MVMKERNMKYCQPRQCQSMCKYVTRIDVMTQSDIDVINNEEEESLSEENQ